MHPLLWLCLLFSSLAAGSVLPSFDAKLIRMNDKTQGLDLALTPVLRLGDGSWLTASSCSVIDATQRCDFPGLGQMTVRTDGKRLHLSFQAATDLDFRALGLRGSLSMPGARTWLSQGFQSWSQTGMIKLRPEPAETKQQEALEKTGEDEVYRRGQELSWWMSYIGSDQASFLAGATTAATLKSYVQFFQESVDQYQVKLISGGVERIRLRAGDDIGESWFLSLGSDLQGHLDEYAETLETRRKTLS